MAYDPATPTARLLGFNALISQLDGDRGGAQTRPQLSQAAGRQLAGGLVQETEAQGITELRYKLMGPGCLVLGQKQGPGRAGCLLKAGRGPVPRGSSGRAVGLTEGRG